LFDAASTLSATCRASVRVLSKNLASSCPIKLAPNRILLKDHTHMEFDHSVKAPRKLTINGMSLSPLMAAMMLQHVNGSRALRFEDRVTIQALRTRGLIYFNRNVRPTRSLVTSKGRDVIASLLASQAESSIKVEAE
jgi:hypothetical protein